MKEVLCILFVHLKDVLLILFGSLLTCGTTWFLDWLKFKRELKLKNINLRKDIYEKFYEFFVTTYQYRSGNANADDVRKFNYIELEAKSELYSSRNFHNKLTSFIERKPENQRTIEFLTKEEIEVLQGIIRDDLMIKD